MELPDWYRELALKNVGKEIKNKKSLWLCSSIERAFIRFNTKEWSEFRAQIYYHFWNDSSPLPPLPQKEVGTVKNPWFGDVSFDPIFVNYNTQPTMRLNNWLEYPVASLEWLDGGKTLRAFPEKKLKKWEIKSYVIYTDNTEESEVGAALVC